MEEGKKGRGEREGRKRGGAKENTKIQEKKQEKWKIRENTEIKGGNDK